MTEYIPQCLVVCRWYTNETTSIPPSLRRRLPMNVIGESSDDIATRGIITHDVDVLIAGVEGSADTELSASCPDNLREMSALLKTCQTFQR